MAHDVFISYRRDGGLDLAGRIKDHLVLAGYNPFYDVETMKSGRFDRQLYEKIDECEHFLLILPPKGLNRCKNKGDWVRKEIEYAIQKKKHIITVLMPGFSFPKSLPPTIDVIRYVQAVVPTPETFEHTIAKIVEYLKDQNWSPVEYEDDVKQEPIFSFRKTVPFAMLFVCLFLAIGLLLWHPWGDSIGTSTGMAQDKTAPTLYISSPVNEDGLRYIELGGTVIFSIEVSDNKALKEVNVYPDMIELDDGLAADITVTGTGYKRTVTLTNVSGLAGEHTVTIREGCAVDEAGNNSFRLQSESFYLTSDQSVPVVNIGAPILSKDKVVFEVYCADDTNIEKFEIRPVDISTMGFVAEIEVLGDGSTKQIALSNINTTSTDCYIVIAEGVATDLSGNRSNSVKSHSFDVSKPALTISAPSSKKAVEGGTVSFTVAAADNVQITHFGLQSEDILLHGFTADIEIVESTDFSRKIVFSNVHSTSNNMKYFDVKEGIAMDSLGNGNKIKHSPMFEMESEDN